MDHLLSFRSDRTKAKVYRVCFRGLWYVSLSRLQPDTGSFSLLTVYGRHTSFNVQKVLWFLDEIGLAYHHVELGGDFGGLDTDKYRRLNPHGKVPLIDDCGTHVWESHAILRYLAARYSAGQYWSDVPADRAQIDQWMDWSQTALQPAFLTGVFWGFYRTPEAQRNMEAVNRRVSECARCFRLVDAQLENRYFLLGDTLSLADIPIGTHLYRYFNLDIDRPRIGNVENWYERLRERPGFEKHIMVPFDDLYGRLEF